MFKKIYISIKSYIIGKKLLKAQYFININEYEKSGFIIKILAYADDLGIIGRGIINVNKAIEIMEK